MPSSANLSKAGRVQQLGVGSMSVRPLRAEPILGLHERTARDRHFTPTDASGKTPPSAQIVRVRQTRAAAVLVAIFADPPHPVIFLERAAHLRDHPGQIGLPGGSVDPADGDDRTRTALRELHEEVGVGAERVTVVGRLPEARQRSNNFIVTPIVGVLRPATPLTIDATETAAVFTVPLDEIVTPGAVHPGIETIGERAFETWLFDYGELHVWGLTAGILHDFVAAWHDPHAKLRPAIERELHSRV